MAWPGGCGPGRAHRAASQPPSALLVAQQRLPPAGRSVAEVNRPPLLGTPGGAVPEGVGPRRIFCRDPALLLHFSLRCGRESSLSWRANRARCSQGPWGERRHYHSGAEGGRPWRSPARRGRRLKPLEAPRTGEPLGGGVAIGAAAPGCLPSPAVTRRAGRYPVCVAAR